MPFFDEKPVAQDLVKYVPLNEPAYTPPPDLEQTFGAAFRLGNVVNSFISSSGKPNPLEYEAGFDPIDYIKDDPEIFPYVDSFVGVFNKKAADAKILQIRQEHRDRRTLDAAGPMGYVAQVAAGVFDLPTLLPIGGWLASGGRTAAGMGARLAVAAGADTAISEFALQATQETRTFEESAINVGGSILLGGALGGLIGRYMDTASTRALSAKIEAQEAAFGEADNFLASRQPSVAGAAATETGPLVLKDEAFLSKLPLVNRQDPLIRLQLSEFDSSRETVRRLAETPLEYADNAAGIATELGGAVETRVKMWNAPLAKSLRAIDTYYARYFHGTAEPTSIQIRLSPSRAEFARMRGGEKMTYSEFKQEVGRAAYLGGRHEIPEVASAARIYREFDDDLKAAAVEARLLPEDVRVAGDVTHRFRMYRHEAIIAKRGEFARILTDYFKVQRNIASKSADAGEFGRLTDAEVGGVVDEVIDTILGHAEGRIPYDIVSGPRGALKERLLRIETAKIHEFVENDIERVMHAQMRTMAPDIELAKKFGSVDLAEQVRKINDEANSRIAAAATAKERQRLEKARSAAVRDVEGIRDRLRGTYRLPSDPSSLVVRAGRIARNINYLRLLGGMTVSAIPDMAKVVFTHGLTSTFRDGFIPMVRNFRAFRVAAQEVKLAGTALDMILDSRVMAMADIMDEFGRQSKFERGVDFH